MQNPKFAIRQYTLADNLDLIIRQIKFLQISQILSTRQTPNLIKLQIQQSQIPKMIKPSHLSNHIITKNQCTQFNKAIKMGNGVYFKITGRA
jgi:hypothetical protein